ncbi:MAG: hypothetical protein II622_03910, partial [Thermoguttaceae bacterium]|nr:hypothetical protein [Thermoguttaceae bacterium]
MENRCMINVEWGSSFAEFLGSLLFFAIWFGVPIVSFIGSGFCCGQWIEQKEASKLLTLLVDCALVI